MSAPRLSDAGARELAQTCFDRPLLLEAGAGTGKTAALVARIVIWALGPGWERASRERGPEQAAAATLSGVVAITFTEAAAAEMATRIAEDLAKLAEGKTPDGYFTAAPLPPPAARRERARALIGALDHLTVRTIHAFCRRLLAAHPLEAGLHPALEVDPDAIRADAVAREAIETRLAAAHGRGLDADLAALAAADIGPHALHEALLKLLEEGARPEDLDEELLGPRAARELADALCGHAETILSIEGGTLGKAARNGVATCARLRELQSALASLRGEGLDLDALARAAEPSLETAIATLRKWAGGELGATEIQCFGERAGEVAEAAGPLRDGLLLLERLDPAALFAARRVLAALLAECAQRLRAAGVATFGALLRDGHALLTQRGDVAARMRGEIHQLLVDEFQDTDGLQCEMIEALAFGGGERPALFLVGDPKQSIYGWRNADLAAYQRLRDRVRDEGGIVAELVVNRRSVKAILDEVGRLIAPAMLERESLQPPYRPLEVHPESAPRLPPGNPAVEHWLSFVRDADGAIDAKQSVGRVSRLEAEALARDLLRLRERGEPLGGVGVLLRATTGLETVLGALRRAGIPFVVERETRHGERRELVEARAFLRCVLDPHDQLALVAALRAPAVGVPDAALVPLWRHGFPRLVAELGDDGDAERLARLRDVAREAARAAPSVAGGEWLAGFEASLAWFLAGLAELRRCFAQESPERFVERLREVWQLEAAEAGRFLGAHRLASTDRLLRDLAQALEDVDGSAAGLLSALRRSGTIAREHEEGRPRALAGDAVQVMTIHRAKGLEFDHVYLLQCHRADPGRPAQERETRIYRGRGLRAFELIDMPSPGAWRARAEQRRVERYERVRLLYVAATRARERLVISWSAQGEAPDAQDAKSFADLLLRREDPVARLTEAIRSGGVAADAHGVPWRALAWDPALPLPGVTRAERALDLARVAGDERELIAQRRAARAREARAWHRAASELAAASEEREPALSREDEGAEEPTVAGGGEPPDRTRRVAMAAGSAVHAALEHADLAAATPALAADGEHRIARALAALEPADERAAAELRARAIWRGFCDGPLLPRLRALAPRVLARELPVLLAPDELALAEGEAPVGFVSGAIDLLYADERGEVVVADFKTDEVAGEAALRERCAHYARQADVYTLAVQRALGLSAPPRFELWFLRAGQVR